jgi:hypothetical protein
MNKILMRRNLRSLPSLDIDKAQKDNLASIVPPKNSPLKTSGDYLSYEPMNHTIKSLVKDRKII